MNKRELNSHAIEFKKHLSTFHETSKTKADDARGTGVEYCLSEDISLEAVDFDAVQRDWYQVARANGEKSPCSVDAVYFADGKIYAIEFKSGTNIDSANLVRKIYDTVIALIEKDHQDIAKCRSKVEYVVVTPDTRGSEAQVTRRVALYREKPWEENAWDRWKLYNLEKVIVAKTAVIPPYLFPRFAKTKHWTS